MVRENEIHVFFLWTYLSRNQISELTALLCLGVFLLPLHISLNFYIDLEGSILYLITELVKEKYD